MIVSLIDVGYNINILFFSHLPIVEIGFEETVYSVSESDGSIELAVRVINGNIAPNRDITISLTTNSDTATGKQADLNNSPCLHLIKN